jgi:hypothetical protein
MAPTETFRRNILCLISAHIQDGDAGLLRF